MCDWQTRKEAIVHTWRSLKKQTRFATSRLRKVWISFINSRQHKKTRDETQQMWSPNQLNFRRTWLGLWKESLLFPGSSRACFSSSWRLGCTWCSFVRLHSMRPSTFRFRVVLLQQVWQLWSRRQNCSKYMAAHIAPPRFVSTSQLSLLAPIKFAYLAHERKQDLIA